MDGSYPFLLNFVSLLLRKNVSINSVSHLVHFFWFSSPSWAGASSFTRFLDHTQRRTTFGRTPLDEWLARRRDLYLTIHNTHNGQTYIPSVGFEPTISPGERPQTHALDRAATGTGSSSTLDKKCSSWLIQNKIPRYKDKSVDTSGDR
jgi:hypothetical protein